MIFDVTTTVRIRVKADDVNKAENHVLTMLETKLSEVLDSAAVVETSITLAPDNPTTEEVNVDKKPYTKDDAIVDLLAQLKDPSGYALNPEHVELIHAAELVLQDGPDYDLCVSGFAANGGHCSDPECVCNLPEGFRTEVTDDDIDIGALVRWIDGGKGFRGNVSGVYDPTDGPEGDGDYFIDVEPVNTWGVPWPTETTIKRSQIVGVQR